MSEPVLHQPTPFPPRSTVDLDWKVNSLLPFHSLCNQVLWQTWKTFTVVRISFSPSINLMCTDDWWPKSQLRSFTKSVPNTVTGSTSAAGFSRKGVLIVVLNSWQQTSACPSGESWCWQRVDAGSFYWSDSLGNPYQSWHLTNRKTRMVMGDFPDKFCVSVVNL